MPVYRSINPTASTLSTRGVYFETMAAAWPAGDVSAGLWYTSGSTQTLWTIDNTTVNIRRYTDHLTAAPELVSPADGGDTGRENEAYLGWEALPSATYYYVWLSTDPNFVNDWTAAGGAGNFYTVSSVPSFAATNLVEGVKYYWKVASADSDAPSGNKPAGTPTGRALSLCSET